MKDKPKKTQSMVIPMINLDKAATTAVNKRFLDDIRKLAEDYYNPSSANSQSIRVRRMIEDVRAKTAKMLNCSPEQIYFVSGASEGNAMIVNGYSHPVMAGSYMTVAEHSSLLNNPYILNDIGIDKNGQVDEEWLDAYLRYYDFVSIGYASSETGAIQNIKKYAEIVHRKKGFFMSDLTSVAGKIPVDVVDLDIDAGVFSGHKFHALKGIGVVYIKNSDYIDPIIHGTQENGMRGGTLNTLAILSLGYAIDDINYGRWWGHTTKLNERLLSGIREIKEVKINSPVDNCLPSIISLYIDIPVNAQNVVGLFDDQGIIISAGTACAAYESKPSKTLLGMGFDEERVRKSIRVSWDEDNTVEDIDEFIRVLKTVIDFFK